MDLIFSESIQDRGDLNKIVDKIKPFFKSHTLILLDGDLGVGKTTLTSQLLKSCGYDQTTSPTYALHHSYPVVLDQENIKIEHLDLYRLHNEDDVESSGVWDLFQDTQSVILIEWADRVPIDQWPFDWKRYRIQITKSATTRTYKFFIF